MASNRIRKAFKCHCGKSYKTSQKLKNHTLLIHSAGSTSDLSLSSSSMSSLNSAQQLSDSASPPLAITSLKSSINLVTMKPSKTINGGAGSSKVIKENIKGDNKIPKLTPMKGYDGLGILTPATSPKNQAQQQQQQQLSTDSNQLLNGTSNVNTLNNGVENLQGIPLTPVSPAPSPSSSTTSTISYHPMKKGDS
ncbi:CLUMA_CG006609, isoform A [Clunio marinus]|uniref:CLUMA_CG006609, isoform A n=1 Tax=Clunio marinus TaxID=568069 RepID=A0A1J1HYH6_9DIPT|nr:CLUMA_CG006609, isoform A [Clunio marinus]